MILRFFVCLIIDSNTRKHKNLADWVYWKWCQTVGFYFNVTDWFFIIDIAIFKGEFVINFCDVIYCDDF